MTQDRKLVRMIKIVFQKIYHNQYIRQNFQKIKKQDKNRMTQIVRTL